jgi:uncharacterized protein YjcR
MRRKGRDRRGEKHGSAKLTLEQVRRIKKMLAEDKMYASEIAREFGVSETAIRAIKKGKTWKEDRELTTENTEALIPQSQSGLAANQAPRREMR